MQTHSLQVVPSWVSEIVSITIDVSAGSAHAATRNAVARGSRLRRVSSRSVANRPMNANTAIAGKAIGTPPHTRDRITDEYELIIATWQPDSPACPPPGMNEQCRLWTCRSRCWTKSYVDTP